MTTTLTVTDFNSLESAISTVDAATSGDYLIKLSNDIFEGADSLTPLYLKSGVTVTIDGANHAIDGGGAHRGFFVYSGTVTIANLTIRNMAAIGGAGGAGAGGGAGSGGGLFVANDTVDGAPSAGNVTLVNVAFANDKAQGGSGGTGLNGSGGGFPAGPGAPGAAPSQIPSAAAVASARRQTEHDISCTDRTPAGRGIVLGAAAGGTSAVQRRYLQQVDQVLYGGANGGGGGYGNCWDRETGKNWWAGSGGGINGQSTVTYEDYYSKPMPAATAASAEAAAWAATRAATAASAAAAAGAST